MNAAREDVCRRSALGPDAALGKLLRTVSSLLLAAALALPTAMVFAQDSGGGGNPIMPKFSIGGEQKRKLTPEEEERQKQIDADYKAATSKIPSQKTVDPWGDVRQAPPVASAHKSSASSQSATTQKKKPPAQQPQ